VSADESWRRAALALGANLGDRLAALQYAVDGLAATDGVRLVAVSSVYETDPVGGPGEQPDYLNAVAVVDTSLRPDELLARAHALEDAAGRVRVVRWGPRTLDVDVLAVGSETADTESLQLPHPRVAERAFVLVPWADVDPTFDVPGLGAVSELLARLGPAELAGVRPRDDLRLLVPSRPSAPGGDA
jgi:2-amino-4-hydroxy-6-hydroxymethyldihydropteridine diphosphokinase